MERGGSAGSAPELGGEFPVTDLTTGEIAHRIIPNFSTE